MLLDKKTYFIKEQVQFLKFSGRYDIFDPISNTQIGFAKEEPGVLTYFLKFFLGKQLLPNQINVYDTETGLIAFIISKSFSLFRSNIKIYDEKGYSKGYFKDKLFSLSGGFWVFDSNDNEIAEIKGDWIGWNFNFLQKGVSIGNITKKWAGLRKEFYTSADNYVIDLTEETYTKDNVILLLAAGLAIDIVYKEN